jgi:hypothetical protein
MRKFPGIPLCTSVSSVVGPTFAGNIHFAKTVIISMLNGIEGEPEL